MKLTLRPGLEVELDEQDVVAVLFFGSWSLNGKGYPCAKNKTLHTFIAERMGLIITETVDHEDRNKLNCKRENLRSASHSEQNLNRESSGKNTSGHANISWHSRDKRWIVHLNRDRKRVFYKSCITLEEAIEARDTFLKAEGRFSPESRDATEAS